jgi:rSAM/selenodomain-associated transferase 1
MNRLAVFARWPTPGAVKSRLSPALPSPLNLDLYRAMLRDALAAASGSGAAERFLSWDDAPAGSGLEPPDGFVARSQRGHDLGERLTHALDELLAGTGARVVVIGADCPELTPGILREAFDALGPADLVLGPASDGGYYLIGLRRPAPALFASIAWGTASVLEQTLDRARRSGLETALLGGLADLDTPDDLVRFAARCALAGDATGRHTVAALRELGLMPRPR